MLRTQRWVPDHCANPATGDACSLIEEWDDAVPVTARIHKFVEAEKLCSRHAAQHGSDHAAAFTANYEENRRKNIVIPIAQSVKSALIPDHYSWAFDASGVLTVSFAGNLTTPQKAQLQSHCDLQFGPGKVMVT